MIYEKTANFYNQKINVTTIREYRFYFFASLCRGKKIMHIGCADSMVFNVDSNLHIFLSKIDGDLPPDPLPQNNTGEPSAEVVVEPKTVLHGLDIDVETTNKLAEACPGTYFTSYDQVKDKDYDLVLVPEVMEHVPNVQSFIKDVLSICSKEYIFTVPNMSVAQIFCDDTYSLEMIHPDHKYWFSPYTLYNTMAPYSEDYNMQMYYLENKSQIGIRLWKKSEEQKQQEREAKEAKAAKELQEQLEKEEREKLEKEDLEKLAAENPPAV